MFDPKTYKPAGPVMKAFHESDAFYRALAGPIGSSKTTGAGVAEPVFGAMLQQPYSDGVRRFKSGVLRDTYRNLYATTMKTWLEWIPREVGHFTGSDDRPAMHKFDLETPIGPCEIEVEFRALGPNSVEAVCRGWELNGAYLDEADLMPPEAVSFLGGRVMRAGDVKLRRTRGVWFTFNKPDVDHFLYNWCEEGGLEGLAFFDQPGGLLDGEPYRLNPSAENLAHLDPNYYVQAATGQPDWYITRMIRNKWGASISGEPIYPEFRRERHVSPVELEPRPGSVLKLGLDGGGTPAAVVVGRDTRGRRIVFAEVVLVDPYDPKGRKLITGVGAARFADAIRDVIFPRFKGCTFEIGYGDPAAFYGADREAGEYSFMEAVSMKLGIPIIPTDSNEIGLRLDAVHLLMRDTGDDGRPQLIFNPSCKWLIRGCASDYKWEQRDPKQPGKTLKPQKSATSHVHDALQYSILGDVGRAGVQSGRAHDRWIERGPLDRLTKPKAEAPTPWNSMGGDMRAVVKGTHYEVKFNPWG